MTRRTGVTLVEVLVAIFIMGIGMIALLTLFPLGALTMAQAIKDDRTGHAAANAAAVFKTWNLGHNSVYTRNLASAMPDATGTTAGVDSVSGLPSTPFNIRILTGLLDEELTVTSASGNNLTVTRGINGSTAASHNPGDPVTVISPSGYYQNRPIFNKEVNKYIRPGAPLPNLDGIAGYFGPSYPLYIDPIGAIALGSNTLGNITRVSPTLVAGSADPTAAARRWFSFHDDITFPESGVLANGFDREGRYSWAYLCRMPVWNNFAAVTSQIDFTVVVYSGRSMRLNTALSNASETAYGKALSPEPGPVTFVAPNRIQIQWAVTKPNARKGGWILDDRMLTNNPPTTPPAPQGYFYRIVNATDIPPTAPAIGAVELELQTDLRWPTLPGPPTQTTGSVVILDNVVEVFERGPYAPGN